MDQPASIIFWGAGATMALGMRMTEEQTRFIKEIAGAHATDNKPLVDRVAEALGFEQNRALAFRPRRSNYDSRR